MKRADFWKVFSATFSVFLAIGVMIPVLPGYVRGELMASDFMVGFEMAMQAVGAIGSRIWVGGYITSRGSRAALRLATGMCFIGGLIFLLPPTLVSLGIGRALQGIGEGLGFTGGVAWVIAKAPSNRRGKLVSLYSVTLWLGSMIGPPMGSFAFNQFGFRGVAILVALIPFVGHFLVHLLPKEEGTSSGKVKLEWIPKETFRPGTVLGLASAGFVATATFASLLFTSRGWIGAAWPVSLFAMGFVIMRVLGGGSLDKLSVGKVAGISSLLEAAGLLGIAFAPGPITAVLGAFAAGLGTALIYPAMALQVISGVDLHRHGTVLGWYSVFWDLSLFISNLAFGLIATYFKYPAVFFAGAVCSFACCGAIAIWFPTRSRSASA